MQQHSNLAFLFRQLVARELLVRYRATALGTIWLVLQPLLMLTVYTLVFSGIFKVRWAGAPTSLDFALMLFAGLIVFNFFSEVLIASAGLVTAHPNYVKKVVFPVEILACVRVAAAATTAFISLVILLGAQLVFGILPTPWFLLAPVILLFMVPMLVGLAWLLSALGVYVQDIAQIAGLCASILLFLSPIFFPASAIPPVLAPLLWLNPLVVPIEELRNVTVHGHAPDWMALFWFTALSSVFAALCWNVFRRLERGFADVL